MASLAEKAARLTVPLSNGVKFPLLGLGTWQNKSKKELTDSLKVAIDIGYRYFDTAALYDNEAVIGEFFEGVFKEGKLKREDIFITTKLPFYAHNPDVAERKIEEQLKALRTPYIDCYIIHNACSIQANEDGSWKKNSDGSNVWDDTKHIDTWRVLERYYNDKKFRSIGVSNFRCDQLQALYNQASVKPMNLQIELHIFHRQRKLVDLCKKLNIVITSYATLGSPGRLNAFGPGEYTNADCLGNPLVIEMAKKYNKTESQILLRHCVQQNISVIPKSSQAERIKLNFDILDFELSAEDMKRFDDEIKEDVCLFKFSFAKGHPQWPPHEEV